METKLNGRVCEVGTITSVATLKVNEWVMDVDNTMKLVKIAVTSIAPKVSATSVSNVK